MIPNRSIAPESQAIENIKALTPKLIRLDNQIPVYLIDSGTPEVCKMEIIFRAGAYFQTQPLISRFTNLLMCEGTRSRSGFEIASMLEYFGSYLNSYTQKDIAGFSLSALNSKLVHVLPIMEDILKEATFPEDELQLLVQKERKTFIDDSRKVSVVAQQEFNELIFGSRHPYGRKVQPDDFNKIRREQLIDFHKNYYPANRCFMIISGKLPTGIDSMVNKHFGSKDWISSTEQPEPEEKPFDTSSGKSLFKEMPDVVQNAIRIGKRTIKITHPDYAKFSVVNTILGGYFGSRLMSNIREDKGYTYGIYSGLSSFRKSGVFYIAAEVGSDVCKPAIDEIYNEMERLSVQPVMGKELELVRNYMLGGILRSLDGPFATANLLKSLIEFDMSIDTYIQNLFETIKNITSDEILKISQRYLQRTDMSEQVAGRK
jgi:predicted Zn-dependent peptidase